MTPTKYPLQSEINAPRPLSDGLVMPSCVLLDDGVGEPGREAPLDSIEEHLTYEPHESTVYRRAAHGGQLIKNWFVPEDWQGTGGQLQYVLKIQPLGSAGYEATVRQVDMDRIGDAVLNGRRTGKREAPEEISAENQQKAASRAKRQMRLKVKNMMADHLVTFTKAEGPVTTNWGRSELAEWDSVGRSLWEQEHGAFWGPDEWAVAWDKFRRLLTRVLGEFPYVAILEKHIKGNYHLHVAWCGRVNVGIVRKMWLLALGGGKGSGNIDAKHIKAPAGCDRATRIARYISKYVSKHFDAEPRYNKKRYWASRQTLEEARRYVLSADTLDGAVEQMRRMLGLDFSKFVVLEHGKLRTQGLFNFPDGSGLWLSYNPDIHATSPPF